MQPEPAAAPPLRRHTLPGERISLQPLGGVNSTQLAIDSEHGTLHEHGDGQQWQVIPGIYPVTTKHGVQAMTLQMVVAIPASQMLNGRLNGCRIDNYPKAMPGYPHTHGSRQLAK